MATEARAKMTAFMVYLGSEKFLDGYWSALKNARS
jgi:hypothetical protein